MLADVTCLGLSGGRAVDVLDRSGITANKNVIPFDQRKPVDPSGIRFGTPALTTRGMGPDQMRSIGGWIVDLLKSPNEEDLARRVRGGVSELCRQFPVPGDGDNSP